MKSNTTKPAIFLILFFSSNQVTAESKNTSLATWDGQYIGFTAGVSKGKADPKVKAKVNGYFITTDPDQINPEASKDMEGIGVNGNLLWGLNYQSRNVVYGLEADMSLTDYNKEYKSGNITYLTQPTDTFSVVTNIRSNWAISLRPRIGYIHEKSLFYLSAGPSIRHFNYDFTFTDTYHPQLINVNENKWKLGWAASLGYELKMEGVWTLKVEYLYSSYKDIVDTQSTTVGFPNDGFTHKLDFTEQSLRLGLIKKF